MDWSCNHCTFININADYQCAICGKFESSFATKWEDATIMIIGAAYDDNDVKFWTSQDPNYIGIGAGKPDQTLRCRSPWQELWDNQSFWFKPTPSKAPGFTTIFIDRSVWNIISKTQELMNWVVIFVLRHLKIGGCLKIPYENWVVANNSFMKHLFSLHAHPKFNRAKSSGYTKSDSDALTIIIQSGEFMICDDVTQLPNVVGRDVNGRKGWQAILRMRPLEL